MDIKSWAITGVGNICFDLTLLCASVPYTKKYIFRCVIEEGKGAMPSV